MRVGANLLILCATAVLAAGCVDRTPPPDTMDLRQSDPQPLASSALVFNPPISRDLPPVNLDRQARQQQAIIGFDSVVTTNFYIRNDDRQSDWFHDNYERRAISERSGISFR